VARPPKTVNPGGGGGAILNQRVLAITDGAVTNSRAGGGGAGGDGSNGTVQSPEGSGGQRRIWRRDLQRWLADASRKFSWLRC
jgi:hypothetical protein